MTGRLIREASFYARKTRCEMQRDDATTTKRETKRAGGCSAIISNYADQSARFVENYQFPACALFRLMALFRCEDPARAAKHYQTWGTITGASVLRDLATLKVEAARVRH